jgi:hypothetical protein
MTAITKPLYETTLCGKSLRFFASPLLDGKPDFPWHSVDDLQRCMGMSREEREFLLRYRELPVPIQTVATADGPVRISPHPAAQRMILARQELGGAPAGAFDEYCFQSTMACNKLPDAAGQGFEWITAAYKRWDS